MSTLRDNINDITLYINVRKTVKMNVFSLFYTVLILDISLMVSPAVVQAGSHCGDNSSAAFFCANTTTSGYSVFLDISSTIPLFTDISCRCDLRARGEFYLASLLSSQNRDISDMLTVNGRSIEGMVGNSSKRFQSMSITFSAYTGQGIPVCMKISAVNNSTTVTAHCLTHGASGGSGAQYKATTTRNNPITSQKPHNTDDKSGDYTKSTDTDIDTHPGTEPALEQEGMNNGDNIGIIIGAAGGAIVVMVAVILAVVCFYRKRRSDQNRKQPTKAKQPEEDMTECAMYSSPDDDQEKGAKEMAADGSKYSTEPEYSYTTVKVPDGETNHRYEEDDYNHLHQQQPRKRTENVYTLANFKVETKENENETNDYNYSTVQKPRAGK